MGSARWGNCWVGGGGTGRGQCRAELSKAWSKYAEASTRDPNQRRASARLEKMGSSVGDAHVEVGLE